MERTVEVQVKSVYGNKLIYPVNQAAQEFALLIGKMTFSASNIEHIKKLGFEVKQVFGDSAII